ncbi:MAG: acylneuraminate cytidylyltransferase [Bacteroidales bacterium]|nr:acylneuraminate cytidylyltransferase [Bacteroidales bacterium]
MLNGKKVVAFIPVRGGSKSIPLKNIKAFCGMPLIYWNLKALTDCSQVDSIIVATDSNKIRQTVNGFSMSKVQIYDRSDENAQDHSSTESVMLEYIENANLSNDSVFMLVQATSPLTRKEDFEKALKKYDELVDHSILSVVKSMRFYWNEDGTPINYDVFNRPRRQDFHGTLMENGAFYISAVSAIIESKNRVSGRIFPFEMPEYTSFEIDEPDDWIICESLMYRYNLKRDLKNIKLFLTDVDGVLTDAGMYYTESGDELKKFNTLDGKGIELLRKAGIKTGIITTENTKIVENRAKKLKVDYLYQGIHDKLSIAKTICSGLGIQLNEVAFIGDDVNDTELLSAVGVSATPANGITQNKNIPGIIITQKSGGSGAVREFAEIILGIQISLG